MQFGATGQREPSRVQLRSRRSHHDELTEGIERLSRVVYRDISSSIQDEQAKEQFVDALTDNDLRICLMQARLTSLGIISILHVQKSAYVSMSNILL